MKMKHSIAVILILLATSFAVAQKKERIKGSKIVTTIVKEISNFNHLEVNDNIEVYLEKGATSFVSIEADDNLQDEIAITSVGATLQLHTIKTITRFKKLIVRITYANEINSITTKNDAIVNAIQEIHTDNLTLKSIDDSKLFVNIVAKNFALQTDNKSSLELNLKGETAKIVMSESSQLKALVNVTDFTFDQYQKTVARIEGAAKTGAIRLDNTTQLTAEKLQINKLIIITEQSAACSVNAEKEIEISASERSEIQLYGNPKIELKRFDDEAKLLKKK
jgi:hypothetical protein